MSLTLEFDGCADSQSKIAYCGAVAWLLAHTQRLEHLHLCLCHNPHLPPLASLVHLELIVIGSTSCAAVQCLHLLPNLQALQLGSRTLLHNEGKEMSVAVPAMQLNAVVGLRTVSFYEVAPEGLSLPVGCKLDLSLWDSKLQDVLTVADPSAVGYLKWSQCTERVVSLPPLLLGCVKLVSLWLNVVVAGGDRGHPLMLPSAAVLPHLRHVQLWSGRESWFGVPKDAAYTEFVVFGGTSGDVQVVWEDPGYFAQHIDVMYISCKHFLGVSLLELCQEMMQQGKKCAYSSCDNSRVQVVYDPRCLLDQEDPEYGMDDCNCGACYSCLVATLKLS